MTATRAVPARSGAATARPLPVRPSRPVPSRPAPERPRRPDLRIVPVARPRRGGALAVVVLLVVGGALLGTAVLHTMLVSGQREVDRLEERIRDAEQANQARRLDVAELESPARVVQEAEGDGMVDPDVVTWLTRNPDGTVEASSASRPVTEEATDTDGTATDGTATDGTATDGTATDGTATDGTASDGTASDDTASDGTASDGTATDGTASDGTATEDTPTDDGSSAGAG
ncbi:MAG TPA: hypothetical protein VEW93_08545 [Acidimicrobiales bacterium]|nr:hypothetical protein [Acidimicrobiales bacterium]